MVSVFNVTCGRTYGGNLFENVIMKLNTDIVLNTVFIYTVRFIYEYCQHMVDNEL